MATPTMIPVCYSCRKSESELKNPLNLCTRCEVTTYCSRECRRKNWKVHKHFCRCQDGSNSALITGPEYSLYEQYSPELVQMGLALGLANNDYLHRFVAPDVFKQLIDCFRMRMGDEDTLGIKFGICGKAESFPLFKQFLDFAESRPGIIPVWWSAELRMECEKMARTSEWYCVEKSIERPDIIDHYEDEDMPMKLRVLAWKIYGTNIFKKLISD